MIAVGVNGFGTIGKRVADAVGVQRDMRVAGVAKRTPDYGAAVAADRGYPLYAAGDTSPERFRAAGFTPRGTTSDLLESADVVVDATPAGVGAANRAVYEAHDTPAVFQGGERSDVADVSFVARAEEAFDAARAAGEARVVSCNTTGLCRLLAPLREGYGVERVRATLVRRGGDPDQPDRGPIDDILPDPVGVPSHHAEDVQTVFPDVRIDTFGVRVPATLMHLHAVSVTLADAPSAAAVRDRLSRESRVAILSPDLDVEGCGSLRSFAMDAGRPRGDVWENCVWADSLTVSGSDLHCFQAIHQQSDVVPENVDAVRALASDVGAAESRRRTDAALGVGGLARVAERTPAAGASPPAELEDPG